jgi:phospholipid-binding lipoprotein MlaA
MEKSHFKNALRALVLTGLFCVSLPSITTAQGIYMSEDELYGNGVEASTQVSDPFESINRLTFGFNDFVYLNLVQPIADGYAAITPDPVEVGAVNFFRNLQYPIRLAGNLLQGRLHGAWVETGRFVLNSTVGLAGCLDPANTVEALQPIAAEDVGQAFGAWGIGEGPYLVLPLLGPSNCRDLVGILGDRVVNPWQGPFSLIYDWNWEWQLVLGRTAFVVNSPSLLDRYKQMKGTAIDPYGSLKNAYMQNRRAAIKE